MAKLEEIIKTEMSRSDSRTFSRIHLFREGSFLRAYEQSAWLMSRYAAAELNPKRHKTKQTTPPKPAQPEQKPVEKPKPPINGMNMLTLACLLA